MATAARKEWDRLRAAHDAALRGSDDVATRDAWEALALYPAPDIGAVRYKLGELFFMIDRLAVARSPDFPRLFGERIIADVLKTAKAGEIIAAIA